MGASGLVASFETVANPIVAHLRLEVGGLVQELEQELEARPQELLKLVLEEVHVVDERPEGADGAQLHKEVQHVSETISPPKDRDKQDTRGLRGVDLCSSTQKKDDWLCFTCFPGTGTLYRPFVGKTAPLIMGNLQTTAMSSQAARHKYFKTRSNCTRTPPLSVWSYSLARLRRPPGATPRGLCTLAAAARLSPAQQAARISSRKST